MANAAWLQRVKSEHGRRVGSNAEEMYEAERERCELERLLRGSNGTAERPRYCECRELLIDGKRVPAPHFHDCEYVAARTALVDEAERMAIESSSGFTGASFNAAMEKLAWPLLREFATKSENGSA